MCTTADLCSLFSDGAIGIYSVRHFGILVSNATLDVNKSEIHAVLCCLFKREAQKALMLEDYASFLLVFWVWENKLAGAVGGQLEHLPRGQDNTEHCSDNKPYSGIIVWKQKQLQ